MVNLTGTGFESQFSPQSGSESQVDLSASTDPKAPGLVANVKPGNADYPGIYLKPEGGTVWDLSKYGHVTARIANTGSKPLYVSMRLDNAGGSDTESQTINAGESKDLKVIFGYAYGFKPNFKLNPAAVAGVMFFLQKATDPCSIRIESVEAGGPAGEAPPVDPESIRTKPTNGYLLGGGVTIDPAKQIEASGGKASPEGDGLKVEFSGSQNQYVAVKPAVGKWDLRDATMVKVKVKNAGTTAVSPRVQVFGSSFNGTDVASLPSPLAPGAEGEITASFAPAVPWAGVKNSTKSSYDGQGGTGTTFNSDAVAAVRIIDNPADASESLVVESIKACPPEPAVLPDWLGKRPPVPGDWKQTFDEEFDGKSIDSSKWNVYGGNFWDPQVTHYSKDNVIVGGGVAKLHYERKTGFQNDDPTKQKTDYATGYLDTYGKWTQRYGYFEARMKLPKAPGMWPAFWLMPDRGVAEGPQWKRADTARGGMEFDIMEYLSRWGPYRYDIAMHWDGYGANHQATGTGGIYFAPDKDGFITSGLLWTPGSAIYYVNGKEVARWETPRISNVPADIMFTAISGGWDNNSVDDAQLPSDFVIDYVRVWQRKDLASSVDGPKTPPANPADAIQ
ncbi:MAG TPA: glycoside hydrolase family 16 protein [Chthoniobacteraceae bacterium]|nr:glycoside hydrolase family 16 protein [Chthoniobacteraceae bacterium]